MKQKLFLLVILLAFGFLNANAQIEKVSSTYNSLTGKWTYTVRIPAEKSYTQPFVAGDWEFEGNDWKKTGCNSDKRYVRIFFQFI